MAIIVKILRKPYIWLSLVEGGDLELRPHYFIPFQTFGRGYYGWAFSEASEEVSITPTETHRSIKIEWWLDSGNITGISDAGNGQVTVTTENPHGRSDNDIVDIRGTSDYDGQYTINNVTSMSFDINATFTSSQTGKWFADAGTEWVDETLSSAYGQAKLALKWDFYSMKDPTTGEYYPWLNQNDPDTSSYSSYDIYRGHPRWGMRFDMPSSKADSNNYRVVDGYIDRYAQDYTKLYDERKYHCNASGYYFFHPQISHHKDKFPLPEKYKNFKDNLIIFFQRDSTYTIQDLVDALDNLATPYTKYFNINMCNTNYSGWKGIVDIEIFGMLAGYDNFNGETAISFDYTTLKILGGGFFNRYTLHRNPRTINMNLSDISIIKYQSVNWVASYSNMVNSRIFHTNSDAILDFYALDNSEIINTSGSKCFYNKVAGGIRCIGGRPGDRKELQWRYQRAHNDESHLSDVYLEDAYLRYVDDGNVNQATGYMTDVTFRNKNSSLDYDVATGYYYSDVNIDKTMVCKNVTSNRNDGQLLIYVVNVNPDYFTNDLWKFYYDINFDITDIQGYPIPNATITVDAGGEQKISTTDQNGQAIIEFLGYTLSYHCDATGSQTPPSDKRWFTASNWNTVTITIQAPGHKEYVWRGTIKENAQRRIALIPVTADKKSNISISIKNDFVTTNLQEKELITIRLSEQTISALVNTDDSDNVEAYIMDDNFKTNVIAEKIKANIADDSFIASELDEELITVNITEERK